MSLPYIIVPIYNGAGSLKDFFNRIHNKWLGKLIFVDDGCTDDTSEKLKLYPIKSFKHVENRGKGAAIQTAMSWIVKNEEEHVVTIDIDLQHPPELLDNFTLIPNETILLGYRNDRRNMPLTRQLSNFITSLLISIRTCAVIKDSQCGYRSFQTKIFNKIQCIEEGFQFESEFLIKAALAGWKVQHVPIPTIYGNESSAMRNVKDTIKFINMWLKSYFWT